MIKKHEGFRAKPYQDSVDKTTIGWGRNLSDDGISVEEASLLLENDIFAHTLDAQKIPVFVKLDPVRQDVLISMVFNMGLPRVLWFKKMLAALEAGDWDEAAAEMLSSRWSSQVGNRALELAKMIKTGAYE